jgi:hypothetical protein
MELALDHDAMQTVAQYGKPPGMPVEHLRRPVARVASGPMHDVLVRSGVGRSTLADRDASHLASEAGSRYGRADVPSGGRSGADLSRLPQGCGDV